MQIKPEAATPIVSPTKLKVAIIGAGPVGAYVALRLAQHPDRFDVSIYEARLDPRSTVDKSASKSVNLAISHRGLAALRTADPAIATSLLAHAVPMYSRLVHIGLSTSSQAYGLHGEHINSVSRGALNNTLLDAAQRQGVAISFDKKLRVIDLSSGRLTFTGAHSAQQKPQVVDADLIVGADGSFSAVRTAIQRITRMDLSQSYIPECYCELTIPPGKRPASEGGASFAKLDVNHLHIWPRVTFMLIALPNRDDSFTCTLFMSEEEFARITGQAELESFFRAEFPDVIPLVGGIDVLAEQFFANPRGSLLTIQAKPWHYEGRAVIVGDAAHSMVPFYGQGVNCGLESASLLVDALLAHPSNTEAALEAYETARYPDATAMQALALYNHKEMRAGVRSPLYLLERWVERSLYTLGCPGIGPPLYTMISFSGIPYAQAVRRWKRQQRIIRIGLGIGLFAVLALLGVGRAALRPRHLRHIRPSPIPPPNPVTDQELAQVTTKVSDALGSVVVSSSSYLRGGLRTVWDGIGWVERSTLSSISSLFSR